MLCRRHHRAVHEEGYQVERLGDGDLEFRRPGGAVIPHVPPSPSVAADPEAAIRAANESHGLALHANTARPGWLGERLDVGYAIDVLHPLAADARLGVITRFRGATEADGDVPDAGDPYRWTSISWTGHARRASRRGGRRPLWRQDDAWWAEPEE